MAENAVRSLFIPIEDANLLLPGTVLAEIVPYLYPAAPPEGAPDWLLGHVLWRGGSIPLIAFEPLAGGVPADITGRTRIAVIKSLRQGAHSSYFGILSRQIPRLAKLQEGAVEPLDEGGQDVPGVACQVLANGEPALIPDLDYIAQELQAALEAEPA